MSEEERKATVQVPSAANAVLAHERLVAIERRQAKLEELLGTVIRKLEAAHELALEQARKRESGDERLGRSLDRLDEKVMAVARAQEAQAEKLGGVEALASSAVNGIEAISRELAAKGLVDRVHSAG